MHGLNSASIDKMSAVQHANHNIFDYIPVSEPSPKSKPLDKGNESLSAQFIAAQYLNANCESGSIW